MTCRRCRGGRLVCLRGSEHGCYVCGHRWYSDGVYDPPQGVLKLEKYAEATLRNTGFAGYPIDKLAEVGIEIGV